MPRANIDSHLEKINELEKEIKKHVRIEDRTAVEFRADLAGLLVITIAASYETCVKDVLTRHAKNHHSSFGEFTENNYKKLNSKITISDLNSYAEKFGATTKAAFKSKLNTRVKRIENRTGKSITTCYQQILSWRHAFAHGWVRSTTVEEALNTHRLAKRVIYAFEEAFNG